MPVRSLLLSILLLSCTGASAPAVTEAPTALLPATTVPGSEPAGASSPSSQVPPELAGFPVREVLVAGDPWLVAVADTPERRARGLMGVEELGGLDGMLFVFSEDVRSAFWMKDTLIPLDIAFFALDGSLVEVLRMEPCEGEPCPGYRPAGDYRWALEAPAGRLSELPPESRLAIPGG